MLASSKSWPVKDGYFASFQYTLDDLSSESMAFVEDVQKLNILDPIFFRGSLVESLSPFHLSDIDLIVIRPQENTHKRMYTFQGLTERTLDIKWLTLNELHDNLVQKSLVKHRSIQIAGPSLKLPDIPADFDFAWAHWCTYFPAGLPQKIHSPNPYALIFFKHLLRCFGVLSYLDNPNDFTRDIDQCMHIAEGYACTSMGILRRFRTSLELSRQDTLDISPIILLLQREFDK